MKVAHGKTLYFTLTWNSTYIMDFLCVVVQCWVVLYQWEKVEWWELRCFPGELVFLVLYECCVTSGKQWGYLHIGCKGECFVTTFCVFSGVKDARNVTWEMCFVYTLLFIYLFLLLSTSFSIPFHPIGLRVFIILIFFPSNFSSFCWCFVNYFTAVIT